MSTPPKRLERSRTNKVLGGVCGGVADYLNMDPTLVRVLTAVLTLFTGIPIVVYLVMLFVVPEQPRTPTGYQSVPPAPAAGFGSYDPGLRRDDAIWGTEGAPWEQRNNTAPAPSASYRPAPTSPPVWAQPRATQPPVPSEPVPNDPPPVEPYDPDPVGPSDPEAPVVAPAEPGPNQPTVPTDDGRPRF